jgi:orotate phosphoribosyltransferase
MFRNREPLRRLIVERAIRPGPITLSNGSVSSYYFDCKRLTLNQAAAVAVGDAMCDVMEQLAVPPSAIGGLSLGADPIVGAVMLRAFSRGRQLEGFYVRKTPKLHGTKNHIENEPAAGTPVVIVDDVITTGKSVIDAIDRTEEQIGAQIVGVITIVDRLEGGTEKIRKRVPYAEYYPLFTLTDFPEIEEIKRACSTTSDELSSAGSTSKTPGL